MKKIALILFVCLLYSCDDEDSLSSDNSISIINVENEEAGSNCVFGGSKIEIGIDTNGNNILELDEIQSTNFVCSNEVNTPANIVNIVEELAGDNCISGGFKIEIGIDTNDDNTLNGNEILGINYICNGSNEANELSSLINVEEEFPGSNCALGGIKVETGIDTNDNELLEASEVQSTAYICIPFNNEQTPDNGLRTFYDIEMFLSGGQSLNVGRYASSELTDCE